MGCDMAPAAPLCHCSVVLLPRQIIVCVHNMHAQGMGQQQRTAILRKLRCAQAGDVINSLHSARVHVCREFLRCQRANSNSWWQMCNLIQQTLCTVYLPGDTALASIVGCKPAPHMGCRQPRAWSRNTVRPSFSVSWNQSRQVTRLPVQLRQARGSLTVPVSQGSEAVKPRAIPAKH